MEFDPDLSHLTSADYADVYEPAEDSYLMMDALHAEMPFLLSRFAQPVCVEVGSGSGVLLAYLSRLMGGRGVYWATDINPRAAAATRATMAANKVRLGECAAVISTAAPRLAFSRPSPSASLHLLRCCQLTNRLPALLRVRCRVGWYRCEGMCCAVIS